MFRLFFLLILMLLLIPAYGQPLPPMYNEARNYVVQLSIISSRNEKRLVIATASAVVVAPGLALTANHVVGGVDQIVVTKGTRSFPAKRFKSHNELDIALITGDFRCPCVRISQSNPSRDVEVVSVSYPLPALYDTQILSFGHVQGINSSNMLITTTQTGPGGSGGGIFTKRNNEYVLVGLIVAIGSTTIGPPMFNIQQQLMNLTFSTPAAEIRAFVSSLPIDIK